MARDCAKFGAFFLCFFLLCTCGNLCACVGIERHFCLTFVLLVQEETKALNCSAARCALLCRMWVYTSIVSSILECPSSWAASLADRSASKQMVAKACRNWYGVSNRPGARWARDPVTGQSITVPADMTCVQGYKIYVEKRTPNLTEEEGYAVKRWVSSDFYAINEKLRRGIGLTNEEKEAITNLDHAPGNFPDIPDR